MPASRNAVAITFAPRSCPSSPTFATRILSGLFLSTIILFRSLSCKRSKECLTPESIFFFLNSGFNHCINPVVPVFVQQDLYTPLSCIRCSNAVDYPVPRELLKDRIIFCRNSFTDKQKVLYCISVWHPKKKTGIVTRHLG